MRKSFQYYLGILVFSLIISIPLLLPYFHSGYFPTHDGEWAVVRLSDMFREIRDLQFPPRFSGNLNFGYGYPLFNFAYPLPYYIGVFIHLLGFGFVNTTKILFALTIPASAFFMFFAAKNIWKNNYAGIISSVLYLYFSYRLVDLFVRGSIGESFGFAIFPLILLCLSKSVNNPRSMKFMIVGAFSFAALVLSHNIMAVLFSMSLGVFFIGNYITQGGKILKPYLFTVFFGFILSAFFWVPALLEKNNILLSVTPIADRNLYFVSIKQFLFAPWGYGVPTDPVNGFSYQIGWPFLIILLVSVGLFIFQLYKKHKKTAELRLAITILIGIFALVLFMFSFSKPIWKLPFLSEINYPWTMLSQVGLLTSLLAGYLVNFKYTKVIVFAALILALILYIPLAKPSNFFDRGEGFYFTNDATTTSSNELMPLWVKTLPFQRPDQKVELISGKGSIDNLTFNSKKINFTLDIQQDSNIRMNTIYYPGWEVYDNNQRINQTHNNKFGVMDISVSKGKHTIAAVFSETPLRLVSDLISLIGLLLLGLISLKRLNLEAIKNVNS